jgi:hypothetical protein
MRVRKLTSDNDFSFGNSALDYYFNVPEAVGQNVETGLMLWLGEWFLDTSLGTPYIQGVLGKHTQAVADGTIQNQVSNTTGVVDISSYSSQFNSENRSMSIQLSIDTIYGPTEVEIENYSLY